MSQIPSDPLDLVLKTARAKGDTVDGIATILIEVPEDGRFVSKGRIWFQNQHADDHFKVYVSDENNVLGYGAGTVVGSYTDDDMAEDNQGHYICTHQKWSLLEALQGLGDLPGMLFLKVVAVKGDLSADTARINLEWGKRES